MDDTLKRDAAHAAVDRFVESGMTVGLGTGTTASWAVRRIGEKLTAGELWDIVGVPTSEQTAALAREAAIPRATLAEARPYITIDGADEISSTLDVVKGLGGALLREKIVAHSSENGLVIIADDSKLFDSLGEGPLPVEAEPFGWQATMGSLKKLGCEPSLRRVKTQPFVTDGGHYTIDCLFDGGIPEPKALEAEIKEIPGALECGLFVGLTKAAVVAGENGVEVIEAETR
ncbi:MAG: ribose-5-phosphate isomerase RpiA [Rubrobacter sp.]|jgi:ribose 5-phosphate isomerase A|nr:ribose-5-phosphate isomerase RpiA [Rubrobacter sp.]